MQQQAAQTNVAQLVAWLKLFSNLDPQLKNSPYGQLPLELAVVESLFPQTPAPAAPAIAPARTASAPRPTTPAKQRPAAREAAPTTPAPEPAAANGHAPEPTPAALEPVEAVDQPPDAEELLPPVTDDPQPVTVARDELSAPEEVIEVVDDAAFFLEDVIAHWDQIKEDVRAESPVTHACLNGVIPINVEERTIVLLDQKGFQKQRLEKPKEQRIIEHVLTQVLGGQCFFRVTLDKQEEMPDINKQIQHLRKDELVRKAINIFAATIVAIEKPE
jgi:DNA polymerase-3 subunit gamma/tau